MKKSKTTTNLGLFGLLVISLSMSQGWADVTGSTSLASNNTINMNDPNIRDWEVKDARGTVDGETYTMDFTVSRRQGTQTTFNERMEDGKIVYDEVVESGIEATFCSSHRCGDTVFIAIPEEHKNNIEFLKHRIAQEANRLAAIHGQEKAEADEKAGDLEKRLEEEKECKRVVVDRADKSKDRIISKNKNKKEFFSCKMNNSEDEDEFLEEYGDELRELAQSNDKDAEDILEHLATLATDNSTENYLEGLEDANSKYRKALEAAERGDLRYALALNQELMTGSYAYETRYKSGGWGPFRWGGYRTKRRNGSYVEAFSDIRRDLIDRMNIAINGDVDGLINDGLMTDMDRMCDSAGRGCRVRTSYRSMPRMNFDSNLDTRGVGRNDYHRDGRIYNGQLIIDDNRRGSVGRRGTTGRFATRR